MVITCPAFSAGEMIPSVYTCDGKDISPPLQWSQAPPGTRSFALVSDDPDAPAGTWVHWVVWNIPSSVNSLEENLPARESPLGTVRQGTNDFRRIGYGGPCPPSGAHRYYFRLYALDTLLELGSATTKSQLEKAMKGHVLAQAEVMGKYRRN
jgi:Raf kinase inhibitor-like YbhB/YbcL family protein